MPRAGLVEIMDEMAAQIRGVLADVTDVAVQVEPRMILSPTPPSIDLYPGESSRDAASAAFDDVNGGYLFTVRARIDTRDNTAGQDLLLAFMDDTDDLCLALALLDDPTLNGLAASIDVRDPTGYIVYPEPTGEGAWLGFQFTALVIAAES
jgi:hypothetical protein